jgi:hypothetical protein
MNQRFEVIPCMNATTARLLQSVLTGGNATRRIAPAKPGTYAPCRCDGANTKPWEALARADLDRQL